MTRFLEFWRSRCLLARIGIVVLAVIAIQIVGVVIFSFLLPVTG